MNGQRSSSHKAGHSAPSYTAPNLYDTTALTSALANPYAQHHAPHYYQAYLQAYADRPPRTTSDGYTLSSTYVPGPANQTSKATSSAPSSPPLDRPSVQARSQTAVKPILNHLTCGSWYQSGNCRCTRQGCPFTGSRKSVEIHMMDRHFVFPPGWQKKDDWDTDPSLRGKPVAIQGTSLMLDTPEAIGAWIAERKRRFPTDDRIRDKKRKLEDAVARGQLTPEDLGTGARKKHRQNATLPERGGKGFRGQANQSGRGRPRRGLVRRKGPEPETTGDSPSQPACANPKRTREASPGSGSSTDGDEAPEVVSSKVSTLCSRMSDVDTGHAAAAQKSYAYPQERARRIPQPRKPPRNPFASRSTLLRNLLLPEIRITISNLSQAIHFLAENDFLRDVELRPGEAQERMIEVLEIPCTASKTIPKL